MKCTNKTHKLIYLILISLLACTSLSGCNKDELPADAYQVFQRNPYIKQDVTEGRLQTFSEDLCVTGSQDIGTDKTLSQVAEGAGLFNTSTLEVCYAQNIYKKLYPASTTKILTAYLIIKNCDLTDKVTISEYAADQESDSSVCGVSAGDVITVKDLLYGMMLVSGNDAAIALAEHCSGDVKKFAKLMNDTAVSLGACNSHFVNPNGLPDEDHYTSVYDMYLISRKAIELNVFREIIHTSQYEASFRGKDGETVTKTWRNTNRFITGEEQEPDGISVIGGKTGTTNSAKYCLVIFAQNDHGEDLISIVFKADGRSDLYLLMTQMLKYFGTSG